MVSWYQSGCILHPPSRTPRRTYVAATTIGCGSSLHVMPSKILIILIEYHSIYNITMSIDMVALFIQKVFLVLNHQTTSLPRQSHGLRSVYFQGPPPSLSGQFLVCLRPPKVTCTGWPPYSGGWAQEREASLPWNVNRSVDWSHGKKPCTQVWLVLCKGDVFGRPYSQSILILPIMPKRSNFCTPWDRTMFSLSSP